MILDVKHAMKVQSDPLWLNIIRIEAGILDLISIEIQPLTGISNLQPEQSAIIARLKLKNLDWVVEIIHIAPIISSWGGGLMIGDDISPVR